MANLNMAQRDYRKYNLSPKLMEQLDKMSPDELAMNARTISAACAEASERPLNIDLSSIKAKKRPSTQAEVQATIDQMTPDERALHARWIAEMKAQFPTLQV